MVYLSVERNMPGTALQDIGQAESRWGDSGSWHWLKAFVYLNASNIGMAEREARDLKKALGNYIGKSGDQNSMREFDYIMGRIALIKGYVNTAIEHLNTAFALLPGQYGNYRDNALLLEPLALAYTLSGDFVNARETYEKITQLTLGRLAWGEIYARAFYNLGKIAERQGDKVKARENYGKFLSMWKDADPGLPEVEDARRRLAALAP